MSSSDAVLHRRAETLYAEHHSWLAGWLRHRMGGEDVAADLAQDTFLRVLTSRELPLLLEPRAFLATIARRLMANHYRREAIECAYLEILATLPEARMPSPEDRRLVLEALCAIDRALDALPAKAREAFLLAQLEGMKYEDIAARLGVTTRTVGNYMVRAVQACFFAQEHSA
ncbi:sigma-70 family RNA polymerase sigma factor [Achromobacter denitrificans]|uniref:Sigma-70 family RNA polymerase sigma factor n=1 Tax=Achromobacter denitrificans TaxID=32002 RepID=A0ABZ3FZ10_ACHDE|nr:sigma-70 family RNA polymerase sigma factor [Achromobacter denitrificans]MDF3860888.1 sigma-70 family RNA polymerase sigma factor [Achromobacter denitrificans]